MSRAIVPGGARLRGGTITPGATHRRASRAARRASTRFGPSLAGLVAAVLLAGCYGSFAGAGNGVAQTSLPTSQASLSAEVQGTVTLVQNALAAAGFAMTPSPSPYRPSEPADLVDAPRAVFQIDLADPDQGFVVIYDLPDAATAATRGQDLASYLGSGFGQTNYPNDAQFSIGQVGSTLIFTWWSGDRASDRQRAQTAFDAVASVGQPIPVTK